MDKKPVGWRDIVIAILITVCGGLLARAAELNTYVTKIELAQLSPYAYDRPNIRKFMSDTTDSMRDVITVITKLDDKMTKDIHRLDIELQNLKSFHRDAKSLQHE